MREEGGQRALGSEWEELKWQSEQSVIQREREHVPFRRWADGESGCFLLFVSFFPFFWSLEGNQR